LIIFFSQLLRRYAPDAKVAPSPSGTKLQVKQMLDGRRKSGAKDKERI